MNFIAPCLFGLESLVAEELKEMDFTNVRNENGRVLFEGDASLLPRANICSRFAERILVDVKRFNATTFDELFEGVKSIQWSDYLDVDSAFPVKGWSLNSELKSIPDCQKIIKKAIASSMNESYGISWFEESGAMHQIQFSILKNEVTVMIDTTGVGLHKRGYRPVANEAPIKETLAAAMCKLARLRDNHTLYDPFCGSGTILIEGVMLATNVKPGFRRGFVSEQWSGIPHTAWQNERARALDGVKKDTDFMAYGSDIDENAIELTHRNSTHFGLRKKIKLKTCDFKDFSPETEMGTVICNPPYGERMLDIKQAEELYREMGQIFCEKHGWSYNIISADEEFERIFGKRARKRRKLYNGMIKCTYFSYF